MAEEKQDLCCPITASPFWDPVVTVDGFTYERHAIARWLQKHATSPATNLPLARVTLTPNRLAHSFAAAERDRLFAHLCATTLQHHPHLIQLLKEYRVQPSHWHATRIVRYMVSLQWSTPQSSLTWEAIKAPMYPHYAFNALDIRPVHVDAGLSVTIVPRPVIAHLDSHMAHWIFALRRNVIRHATPALDAFRKQWQQQHPQGAPQLRWHPAFGYAEVEVDGHTLFVTTLQMVVLRNCFSSGHVQYTEGEISRKVFVRGAGLCQSRFLESHLAVLVDARVLERGADGKHLKLSGKPPLITNLAEMHAAYTQRHKPVPVDVQSVKREQQRLMTNSVLRWLHEQRSHSRFVLDALVRGQLFGKARCEAFLHMTPGQFAPAFTQCLDSLIATKQIGMSKSREYFLL